MMKALAFGAAFGAAVQAWRAWPADGPISASPAIVLSCFAIVAAYLGGRWAGRHGVGATAVAASEATAVASNQVNVAVVVPGQGAGGRHMAGGVAMPTEAAPWLMGARPAVELDHLEGLDLRDLADVYEDGELA